MRFNKNMMITGEVVQSKIVHELHKNVLHQSNKTSHISIAGVERNLKTDWLDYAQHTYQISNDLSDYVIVDVPIVTSDIPNRNLHCFPFEELTYFDPYMGKMVYQSFIGSATFKDHANEISKDAKGVIFDASIQKDPRKNLWQIWVLLGFDRTKDSGLANDILSGRRTAYSMGALVDMFGCSSCGTAYVVEDGVAPHVCHSNPGKGEIDKKGVLVYENCMGTNFFETSSVDDPADINAEGNKIWK